MNTIKQEFLERLNSLCLPRAVEIFESGHIPVYETETGRVFKDDGFLTEKVKAVRWVYHKWPYMVVKIKEEETGIYYLFLCVNIEPDYWGIERDESYIINKAFQFCGPAFFPKTKRFSQFELIGGTRYSNGILHIDSSSAAFKDYHNTRPETVNTKHKGGRKR